MCRIASLAFTLALLTAVGCGEILGEVDRANELASKPTGNRPAPAAGAVRPGAKRPTPPPAQEEAPGAAEKLVSQVQSLLGLGGAPKDGRLPPDPNDPMVLCRLDGSTSFMLKSGCIHRRGTVVASKGVPR